MNTFANAIVETTTNDLSTTENGAVTYSTSLNPIVDMFFMIGAKRGASYEQIVSIIEPAFNADPDLAFRVALWARDVREGAGERQTFRHILRYVATNLEPSSNMVLRICYAIRDLGRLDDLFVLLDFGNTKKTVLWFIINELTENHNALMAKWIPRKGKYNVMIRNHSGLSAKDFRKWIVGLTKVVETQMCDKQWDNINYSHVPSVAMARYSKAFARNDANRFDAYINRVKNKEVNPETGKVEKINTAALYPYDIVKNFDVGYKYGNPSPPENLEALQTQWDNLPDFVPRNLSFLPIIDTSSSMGSPAGSVTCLTVATSLGLYLAERNKGAFKDLWLNFSTAPSFHRIEGRNIWEKISNLDYDNWSGSTNLEAAMKLIVNTAVMNNVPSEDLPQYLLVLSDMEFNSWGNNPVSRNIRTLFEDNGYQMPNVIWWNIQSRSDSNIPVRANEHGMALVSGFSPAIVGNLLEGKITPIEIMMNTIMKDRYSY